MRRRSFLTLVGGGSLAWPLALDAFQEAIGPGGAPDDEAYWRFVASQFSIPEDRIYLNNGTLGPAPRVVMDATFEHERRVASTFPPGVRWADLNVALSDLLGGDPEGWVYPRNTTEATAFVANGLDLEAGDEIITTDHEHIGGVSAWELAAARREATLTRVSLPVPARSADQLEARILEAVGPRTRVVAISHVTFTTGTVLPVQSLARRLSEAGVILSVDGAHPPGMLPLDLTALGGDFYASSPHKWLLAPQGSGLLYLAPEWRQRLWPTLASGGWNDPSLGAHRLNHMGTLDESRLAGLLAAVQLHRILGPPRVHARVLYLRRMLEGYLSEIPGIDLASSSASELQSAMISFGVGGLDMAALQRHLAREANIRTRVIGEYGYGWMRLSTHVYNRPDQLERTAALIDRAAKRGLPDAGTP